MLAQLTCPFVPGPLSPVGLAGMCSGAGSSLLDRNALSRRLGVLSGNWVGGEHDIIEAPLELVDSAVSRLGVKDSDE